MSLIAEEPSTWHWGEVRIPTDLHYLRVIESPTFRYQDADWFLQCTEIDDGFICLWMYPEGRLPPSLAPFAVSVWVQGAGYAFNGLSGAVETRRKSPVIWKQKTSEVERILPGFSEDRLLTFRIDIREHDPQTDCNFFCPTAPHCPQFELHATVADASEQVSLTPNSISCLEALSEDFSKTLDAGSYLDVELRCQGHSTWAQRSVLCSRSPVFERMLHNDMVEGRTRVVNIRDMDVDIFRQLLLYLCTGKLDEDALTFDSAISLYKAADMYGVVSLKKFCSDFFRAEITLNNAFEVMAMADAHADTSFAAAVNSYILKEGIRRFIGFLEVRNEANVSSSPTEEMEVATHTSASQAHLTFSGSMTARHNPTAAPLFTRAHYCPQPEKHRHNKIFADASVQTSLTANSIFFLEALSDDFSKMMDAGSDPDVEIRCQGHSTWAHRSVLCSRSPVFERMLHSVMEEGGTSVLNIQDMDADIFRQVLMFLYTGKLDEDALTFDSAMSLYQAADAYGIVSLKTLCSDFLRAELTLDNAREVLAVAEARADTTFAAVVTAYIRERNPVNTSISYLRRLFVSVHQELMNYVLNRL